MGFLKTWLEGDFGQIATSLRKGISVLLVALILTDSITQGYTILRSVRAAPVSRQLQRPSPALERLDVQSIVAAHLFGVDSAAPATGATPVAAQGLSLHLTGTIAVADAPEKGSAMFAGSDNNVQRFVTAGGMVESDRILVGVYADHVVLNHLGVLETLSMRKATAVTVTKYIAVAKTDPVTIETRVDKAAGEYSRMLQVDDNGGSGRFKGVTFSEDAAAAGLSALGVHPGDRLVSINGVRVTSPEALEELSTGGVVALGVQNESGYHLVHVDSSQLR
jgi:type II secretory pathway component PulC